MTNVMYDNVIVLDYDGVCVYWEHAFAHWMLANGYGKPKVGHYLLEDKYDLGTEQAAHLAKMFNESSALSSIPPYKGAIKYIRKLHEDHGYVFHCITAIPDLDSSRIARMTNIHQLFGPTAFTKVTLCGDSTEKKRLLAEYEGTECFWIEDLPQNAMYGLQYGMRPILVDHHYNRDFNHPSIARVNTWSEIYDYVTGMKTHPA